MSDGLLARVMWPTAEGRVAPCRRPQSKQVPPWRPRSAVAESVQGFGRRPTAATPAALGPSSETLICGEACQALSARQLLWFSIGCNERKPFSFLLLRFLLFDRATGFLPPRPWVSHADARRGCQGRPSLRHRSALRRFQAAP
jgi:hypothetical protein